MALSDFFSTVPTIDADEARKMMNELDADEYQMVDVRQLSEYAEKHISSTRLIPLGDLNDRLAELDKNKPTILY